MGKRTAAEADVVDYDYGTAKTGVTTNHHSATHARAATVSSAHMYGRGASGLDGSSGRTGLLESPVPLAWRSIPDRHVEPRGACHTRVRAAARAKHLKLPFHGAAAPRIPTPDVENNDDDATSGTDDDGDHMTELSMALPPLVAPRPRRVVSPDLIFESHQVSHCVTPAMPLVAGDDGDLEAGATAAGALQALSVRRRAFRPIGAGRPDVEITSPPPRAMNPVVLDARFKNMQRLDLQLDARDAPLQPFHRPCAQRRPAPSPVATVVAFAKVVPLSATAEATPDTAAKPTW